MLPPQVTCGSLVKLQHVDSGCRLHSHNIPYGFGRGSGQQSVTCYPNLDSAESYWVVTCGVRGMCVCVCVWEGKEVPWEGKEVPWEGVPVGCRASWAHGAAAGRAGCPPPHRLCSPVGGAAM